MGEKVALDHHSDIEHFFSTGEAPSVCHTAAKNMACLDRSLVNVPVPQIRIKKEANEPYSTKLGPAQPPLQLFDGNDVHLVIAVLHLPLRRG